MKKIRIKKRREGPITCLDIFKAEYGHIDFASEVGAEFCDDDLINQYMHAGFPVLSGCQDCEATLGPWNAYPSRTGQIKCKNCIRESGFTSAAEAKSYSEKLS